MPKSVRFLLLLLPCTVLRFYLGEHSFSFLWFLVLYFPFINWSTYGVLLALRSGLNRLLGKERISVKQTRAFFVWYLYLPGTLVVAEIICKGYWFNR